MNLSSIVQTQLLLQACAATDVATSNSSSSKCKQCSARAEMQQVLQTIPNIRRWIRSQAKPEYEMKRSLKAKTGQWSASRHTNTALYIHRILKVCLIDWRSTLWAAFSRDDPYGVSTLQAGGAAASRYLSRSVSMLEHQYGTTEMMTYRHGGDTLNLVHARSSEPVDRRTQAHCSAVG